MGEDHRGQDTEDEPEQALEHCFSATKKKTELFQTWVGDCTHKMERVIILSLAATGMTNEQIAAQLVQIPMCKTFTPTGVKHLLRIYTRFNP